jgi:hypothetical protein
MMVNRSNARVVCLLAVAALLAATTVRAQNTSSGASYGYVVGQGPINIFFGTTVGTDTERWYTVGLIQGKSYCFETFRGNSEYNVDVDLTVDLIRVSNGSIVVSNDGVSGDPAVGDNSRWTRVCVLAPVTGQYYVRLHKCVCATGRTGNVQFRVSDTTLNSPWWFVSGASGYDAYIELANTTTIAVSVTVTVRSAAGTTLGTSTASIPAGGNMAFAVSGFAGGISAGNGSAQVAHDGPPGAIVGNITTLSAVTGLSFDSPFSPRQGYQR